MINLRITGDILSLENLFHIIIWMMICAVSGECLQHFWSSLPGGEIRVRRAARWLPGTIYFLFTAGWHLAGRFAEGYETKVFFILFVMLVIFGVTCALLPGLVWTNLYFTVTFYSVNGLCYLTAFSITTSLSGMGVFPGGPAEKLAKGPLLAFGLLFCCLLFYSFRKLAAGNWELFHVARVNEMMFSLLPSLTGVIVSILLNRIILVPGGTRINVFLMAETPALRVLIPACSLLSLLSVLTANRLLQIMLRLGEEKSERVVLASQLSQMQEYIGQIEALYSGIRSMKHDMRNHICSMQGLVRADAPRESAAAYLEQMNDALDALDLRFQTGNPVTDVVLNGKYQQAARQGIAFSCTFLFPPDMGISAFDISIILNNGLENALEACRELRRDQADVPADISVKSGYRDTVFLLEIENSFNGKPVAVEADGLPRTTKDRGESHGIGLRNIRKCARKYGGEMECAARGNRFVLSVMMQRAEEGKTANQVGDESVKGSGLRR